MAKNSVRIPFPHKGKDANWAVSGQPPLTSPDLQNVRSRDVQDKRSRGGQRPAVRKVMYWWDYIGSGSDLSLPDPSPIIGMDQVTAVYYASIAGGDPGAGDPDRDGLVFLLNNYVNNEIQIYGYDGNSIAVGDVDDVGINANVGLAIDNDGHIWLNPGGDIFEFDFTGTKLTTGAATGTVGPLVPSNKSDGLIFQGRGDYLTARTASDGSTIVWTTDLGSATNAIQQLEDGNNFYVGRTAGSNSLLRIDRTDGVILASIGKSGVGANAIAIDEDNGWGYHAFTNQIARVDLSDNGDQKSLVIPGAVIRQIILYDGKVYVCGDRATDNNTVWRLDAALAGIEVDYDTGNTAYDMVVKGTTIYVVGITAANEDTDTGNVNLLDSDLVKTETCWNIGPTKDILAIAEKI